MTRRLLAALLAAVLLAPLLLQIRLTDDVLRLLPADAGLTEALQAARRFSGGDVVLVDVDGRAASEEELRRAVADLRGALALVPHVVEVRSGLDLEEAGRIREQIAPHTGAFVPAAILAERTSEAGMHAALSRQLARLSGPGAAMVERTLARDPLGLEEEALRTLAHGAPGASAVGGLIALEPGRALLVVRLDRSPAEVGPDDAVVAALAQAFAACPLPVTWFGGHRMAADTAAAVKHDVHRATLVGLLGLLVVLGLGFRSPRPLLGALVPLAATAVFLGAGVGLVSPVHGIQLGFVSVIAGLAVDYWVHLYVAAAHLDPGRGRAERYAAARRALAGIRVPLVLSAGSTVFVFLLLTRSSAPIVHDLGVTGAMALVGALVGTLVLGPVTYALVGHPLPPAPTPGPHPLLAALLLAGVGALALMAPQAQFNGDPQALLATSAEARAADAYFARHGLTGPRGLVVLSGDPEGLTDRAARLEAALSQQHLAEPVGPAAVWPGPETRRARQAVLPPADVLQARLDAAAEAVGFRPFEGAAQRLHDSFGPLPADLWAGTVLDMRLARHLQGDAALITVALSDPSLVPALGDAVRATDAEARWIVLGEVAEHRINEAVSDLARIGGLGLLIVLAVLAARYRDPARALLAVLPVLLALAAAAGGVVLLDEPWNPVSLGVLVLVLGLALDYGVFMVESGEGHTRHAVVLGAATTLAGFGALWLAQSPALRSVGIVLTFGVGAAALTALVVVPVLQAPVPWVRRGLRWAGGFATASLLFLQADVLLNLWGTFVPPVARQPVPEVTSDGHTWTLGPSTRTYAQGVWLVQTYGDPYPSGQAMGALTVDLRTRLEVELFDSFRRQVSHPAARWIVTRLSLVLGKTLPSHIRDDQLTQIQGVADSAQDPYLLKGSAYTRRVFYHAIHDLGQAFVDTPLVGCTGFMAGGSATRDGHWLLARNFDFEGGVAFDRDKVVWVHQPDEGFAFLSVSFAGMLGVVSGVNERGLAVAINASGSEDPIRPGTPMTLIVREILQFASTLDEAQAVLEARRGFVSENVMVVDAEGGRAALFEVTPERLGVVPVEGWLAVSNHFRSPALADDPVNLTRMAELTTVPRLRRMEELVGRSAGALDLPTAARILADRRGLGDAPLPRGHRHAIDADIATHGVVIDATARTVWVSRFPNLSGGMVRVSLDEVLAGAADVVEVVPAQADAQRALATRAAREQLRAARRSGSGRALALAEAALATMPDHPEALLEYGRLLHEAGRADEARPYLLRALAAPPEYAHQREALERLLEVE